MKVDEEEAAQIVNNVAEEFIDQGRTNFATKRQFCLAIIWLRGELDEQVNLANEYKGELMMILAQITETLGTHTHRPRLEPRVADTVGELSHCHD